MAHRRKAKIVCLTVLEGPSRTDVGNTRPEMTEYGPECQDVCFHAALGSGVIFSDELIADEQMGEEVRPTPKKLQSRPRHVERRISEMGELPVEYGVDPPVLVEHEIPDPVVAMHERNLAGSGHVVT